MRAIIHKIAATVMALVVVFSTLSVTVDMHFCGTTLVDTALFKQADTCGMELAKVNTDNTADCKVSDKGCCSKKQFVVDGQQELKNNVDSLTFDQQVFLTAFAVTYLNRFVNLHDSVIPFQHYTSPLVVRDLQLLDEVFLI